MTDSLKERLREAVRYYARCNIPDNHTALILEALIELLGDHEALARTGAIASAYAKGLEDAAKIAEDYPKRQNPDGEYVPTAAVNMCWREIAAAIRSRIPTSRP